MTKIAIIAGAGSLPLQLAEACISKEIAPFIIALKGQTDSDWLPVFDHEWFAMGALDTILGALKSRHIQSLVMAGGIKRPSWSELQLDWVGLKMLTQLKLWNAGDDGLLSALVQEIEKHGITVLSVDSLLPSLGTPSGLLTQTTPQEQDSKDIKKGITILREMASLDIGQAVIIQQGLVLGIEAIEGTAALIERCGSLKRPGSGGVLVKLCKPQQDTKVDLPTIGPHTIQQIHQNGLWGIAIEAGKSQIINKTQVIEQANKMGIFIIGIHPEEYMKGVE